jgi:hypothetical protein
MKLFFRIPSYGAVFVGYLFFMSIYAPLGIDWMDFHAERVFNAVEFLRLSGLENFGYTVWSFCRDCVLEDSNVEGLYGSMHGISLFPYLLMNYIGGKDFLFLFGPLFDKFIVFICATLTAELMIKSVVKGSTSLPIYLIGIACFTLFSLSPWTYKIFLGGWWEPLFLMFFLLGIYAFHVKKFGLGYVSFFLAGLSAMQWGVLLIIFYSLLILSSYFLKGSQNFYKYFPPNILIVNQSFKIIFALITSVLIIILIKIIASSYLEFSGGSSIFFRIGISGSDTHNGGLIGALQFLGGSRITQCFQGFSMAGFSSDTMTIIAIYNCVFSIVGMVIISLLSIFGIYLLIKNSPFGIKVFLPLIFSLLCMITIFQQSLSVHLMGYSFIFSALFSAGITNLMLTIQKYFGSLALGFIFSIPCMAGIFILSIRVSMLSGMS